MADMIDRDVLLEAFGIATSNEECESCGKKYECSHYKYNAADFCNVVNDQPTIDIVHCKECKYWGQHTGDVAGETDKVKACGLAAWMIGENGYCLYGKRSEDG